MAWQRAANSPTHAWNSLATDEQIREQWQTLDPQHDLPLYGVPFAVKDNTDAQGFHTIAASPGSAILSTSPVASDATVVARLKAQGGILIGKTNLDQYGTGLVGTRSPFESVPSTDQKFVTGGSGSVVACGVVPFALVADTDGSGRVPAALNNMYGLKPTREAISLRGMVPDCKSLGCVSILTSTVDDAETILSLAGDFDNQEASSRSRVESIQSSEADSEDFGVAALNRT